MTHEYTIGVTKIALKKILGFVCNVWVVFSLEDYAVLVAVVQAYGFDFIGLDDHHLFGTLHFRRPHYQKGSLSSQYLLESTRSGRAN
jgi:hypothetical protein